MAEEWYLRKTMSTAKIGTCGGTLENIYREMENANLGISIAEYHCVLSMTGAETVTLVINKIGTGVGASVVNACQVIFNNGLTTELYNIFVSDINEQLLRTNKEYFEWVMGTVLWYQRVKEELNIEKDEYYLRIASANPNDMRSQDDIHIKYIPKLKGLEAQNDPEIEEIVKELMKRSENLQASIIAYNNSFHQDPTCGGAQR